MLEHWVSVQITLGERQRAEGGRVWVYDPFSAGSCHWNPLEGCEDWSRALRQAHWLTDAASRPGNGNHGEEFWSGESAKLLAPLLHAAALSGSEQAIGQVVSWLESEDRTAPLEILRSDGDAAAESQLEGVLALDSRSAGTTYMSTAHLLQAHRFPEVLATATSGFTAEHLLDGSAGTLYLTSSSRHQKMLASDPRRAGVIGPRRGDREIAGIGRAARSTAASAAGRDGTAHRCKRCPATCPTSRPTAFGSRRCGSRSRKCATATATPRTRSSGRRPTRFLGPITDKTTRDEIADLLGNHAVDVDHHATLAPKATAQDLQQLTWGRALVVSGSLPPAVVRFHPHWRKTR
jgi:hypothetical protein